MTAQPTFNGIPIGEYAFPGLLRDRLIEALLSGAKTTTTSLLEEYTRSGSPLPKEGDREAVVDSHGKVVLITKLTKVAVVPLKDVSLDHAIGEGEGYQTVEDWRKSHEDFWMSPEFQESIGAPPISITDSTPVVCETLAVETIL